MFKAFLIVAAAGIASGVCATADAAVMYFSESFTNGPVNTEPFGQKVGNGGAPGTNTNLKIIETRGQTFGNVNIRSDNSLATNPFPNSQIFPGANTLLNINGAFLATINGFSDSFAAGGYEMSFQASAKDATPANPFGSNESQIIFVYLRQNANSDDATNDGVGIRINSDFVTFAQNGFSSNFVDVPVTLNGATPTNFIIRDSGTDISVLANNVLVASYASSFGNANPGHIHIGFNGYEGKKLASLSVTAIPEPTTAAALAIVAGVGLRRRRFSL